MRRLIVIGVLGACIMFIGAAQGAPPPGVGNYIVVLKPGADRAALAAKARSHGGEVLMEYKHALNGLAVRLPAVALERLQKDGAVSFVVPDQEFQLLAQTLPTGVDRIDGEASSTRSGNGSGSVSVNVAVIDSGIDASHPDLNVVGGTNCHQAGKPPDDGFGHGTGVAGMIGALDNGEGVVGVAPGARLWAVKAGNDNGSAITFSRLVCGVDWVTSTRTDTDPTNDIAVANMSVSGKGADDGNCGAVNKDPLHIAICQSVSAGVTYVVGAGNGAADIESSIPAAYDEVLTATALADYDGQPGGRTLPTCANFGADDTAATFSNFATLVADRGHTVAAPGTCHLTTAPGGTYASLSGTSAATPHATGTVALCIASGACASLTPARIIQKIISDAADYNNAKKNSGYGFQGDPLRPISGKYYGYLVRAGLY